MTINIILAAVTGAALSALVAVLYCKCKQPKKKSKGKSAMEFSKRIFVALGLLVAGIAIFVCVMAWRTEDMFLTQSLIENAFGLLRIGVLSYFCKAALENRVKLAHFFPKLKHKILSDRSGEL